MPATKGESLALALTDCLKMIWGLRVSDSCKGFQIPYTPNASHDSSEMFFVHLGHPSTVDWLSIVRYMKSVRGQLQPSGNPTHAVTGFVWTLGTTMSHSIHGSISFNQHFRYIFAQERHQEPVLAAGQRTGCMSCNLAYLGICSLGVSKSWDSHTTATSKMCWAIKRLAKHEQQLRQGESSIEISSGILRKAVTDSSGWDPNLMTWSSCCKSKN